MATRLFTVPSTSNFPCPWPPSRRSHVRGPPFGSGGIRHGAEDHRCGRLLAGELCEGSGERGRERGGDGPESEMGAGVRARNGVGREESEVVPRHGANLL